MSVFHFCVNSSILYFVRILKWKFSFQNLLLETLLLGFYFKEKVNNKYFNIFCSFTQRLGQSLHIWRIALSDP